MQAWGGFARQVYNIDTTDSLFPINVIVSNSLADITSSFNKSGNVVMISVT